jgi:hypothetical protein
MPPGKPPIIFQLKFHCRHVQYVRIIRIRATVTFRYSVVRIYVEECWREVVTTEF